MADWMLFYFVAPSPERFVVEARRMLSSASPMSEDALATFLGRLMAAHPDRVDEWMTALRDLPTGAAAALRLAAWLSGTAEGRKQLAGDTRFADVAASPPDLPTIEATTRVDLDCLWSWYFATGDVRAVERVVAALRWMTCHGAAARLDGSKAPEDRDRAARDLLCQAASWSLRALMKQHPPLKRVCEDIFDECELDPVARVGLAMCLESVDPEGWRVELDPETQVATVKRLR